MNTTTTLLPAGASVILSILLVIAIVVAVLDRIPPWGPFNKRAWLTVSKPPSTVTPIECPYEYLLGIYGKHHFAPFVKKLSPTLESSNPEKWNIILEIMDSFHFCLILVDDISDNSDFRKGHPAAHKVFGASETANRAYFALTKVLNRTVKEHPQLEPWLLQNLEEVLNGQDISLVWRRDGLESLPVKHEDRIATYRRMASLKTGALFRLVGQLVAEDHSFDDLMTRVGWFSQLQNDCKNLYSSDYAKAKGAVAEDLCNGELSYPVILALNEPDGDLVAKALKSGSRRNVRKALEVVRSDSIRGACLQELKMVGATVQDYVEIWGRKERLDLGAKNGYGKN
ncbi:MAG: hypothetical protein M1834_007217 [Cirrosporium novae-zelandiae]|nr:MAG: hypothetical protein M1834_007217 [Cirrosporium novae-zelandiae]